MMTPMPFHFSFGQPGGRSRVRRLFALLGLAGCLICAGCSGGDSPAPQPREAGAGRQAGGTAVIALEADPGVLNPLIHNSAVAGYVMSLMNDALVEMSEDLEWEPRIAWDWQVSPDGLAVTYQMKPWNWSDGVPLTSRDVVHTFEMIKDPAVGCPRRGFFEDVVRAVALDSVTVRYELARPLPDPIGHTWHAILPYHLTAGLPRADVAAWPVTAEPLASGPFLLEGREHNRQISLVRNPRYPGTPPLLDRVVLRILPEENARVLALEAGEVDFVNRIPARAAHRIAENGTAEIMTTGGRSYYYLLWNLGNPRFADALTRRSLSRALDRDRMISALLEGFGSQAASVIPPAVWNHHPGLVQPPFDPVEARTGLAAAGWRDLDGDGVLERDGLDLEFDLLAAQGDPVRESGALIIRENLRDIGAKVEVRVLERAAAFARLNNSEFGTYLGLFKPNLYGDPSSCIRSDAIDQFNKGRYANARVDSLLDLALGTVDRLEALPLWRELQELLVADPPAAYLFYPEDLTAVSRRLHDVRPHILSPLNNISEWWIAPGDRKFITGS